MVSEPKALWISNGVCVCLTAEIDHHSSDLPRLFWDSDSGRE